MTRTPRATASTGLYERRPLHFNPALRRNRFNRLGTAVAGVFAAIAVLPLVLVLLYVLIQGGRLLSLRLFTELPPAPGFDGGGIGNALLGTVIVTLLASLIAIPVGVGGGIYLSEFSGRSRFAQMVRFANDVLAGVPSIISGVFVYGLIVATRLFFGQSYSALAGGVALARAAGETAPLIFTALFSAFWPDGIFNPIATMSVLIFNFAIMPYEAQNELAWAASFILVMMILGANLLARWISRMARA